MRSTISIILFLLSTTLSAQRVTFNDPDLTFSFKKPRNWELIDDGYVVKISPSIQDTSSIFLTFTYFEAPSAIDFDPDTDLPQVIPFQADDPSTENATSGNEIRIANEYGTWIERKIELHEILYTERIYYFSKYNQRWEIVARAPKSTFKAYQKGFTRMIRSLKVWH